MNFDDVVGSLLAKERKKKSIDHGKQVAALNVDRTMVDDCLGGSLRKESGHAVSYTVARILDAIIVTRSSTSNVIIMHGKESKKRRKRMQRRMTTDQEIIKKKENKKLRKSM